MERFYFLSEAKNEAPSEGKSEVTEAQIELPMLKHDIWVGPSIMPADGIALVSAWARANPKGKFWLWIDFNAFAGLRETQEKIKEAVVQEYIKAFKEYGINVYCQSEVDESKNANAAPILIKDITEEKLISDIERYEMYRLDPNYGAASDSLRVKVTKKYGGGYTDCCDIGPGETSLTESGICGIKAKHEFYPIHRPLDPDGGDLMKFNLERINNDALFSTQNNPLVKQLCQNLEKKYFFDKSTLVEDVLERTYGGMHKFDLTIKTTGASLTKELIKDASKVLDSSGKVVAFKKCFDTQDVMILPLRCEEYSLVDPKDYKFSWLYPKIVEFKNEERALELLTNVIKFEITNFKILRLDDHATLLAQSLNIDQERAAALIIEKIIQKINFDPDSILAVQCTYLNKTTLRYYQNNFNLIDKNYLSLTNEYFSIALKYATNYEFLTNHIWYGIENSESCGVFLEGNYNVDQVQVLLSHMLRTTPLIKALIANWDQAETNETVTNNLLECKNVLKLHNQIIKRLAFDAYMNNFIASEQQTYRDCWKTSLELSRDLDNIISKQKAKPNKLQFGY